MVRRTNQGGSVAIFIVVSVILIAGLVGGVYLLNQRGIQARKNQSIASNKNESNTEKSSTNTESAKTSNTETATNNKTVNVPTTATQPEDLPATGVELSINEIFGIYLLVAAAVSYLMSRKLQVHPL